MSTKLMRIVTLSQIEKSKLDCKANKTVLKQFPENFDFLKLFVSNHQKTKKTFRLFFRKIDTISQEFSNIFREIASMHQNKLQASLKSAFLGKKI